MAANGAAFALEHGIPVGGALTPAQQAQLGAPVLWYVNQGGSLTPTVYLPEPWQQQLINLPGGKLDGDVAIALTARHIDNTGFVLTDGQLSIDAEALENQKRNAYYYEKRDVKGGTLTLRGDTVQPGGFMQAAQWELNADKVYSRSGEFIITGADAAQTASRTAAFEAEIRAILGNNFTYETAQDNLKTEFKKDRRGWNLASWIKDTTVAQFAPTDRNIMKAIAAQPGQNYVDEQVQNSPALYAIGKTIVTMVASFFGGPYAGAGAAASWDQYYTYDATGDIHASRRIGAKSFAVSMVSQYVGGQIDGAVANGSISATTGSALTIASQAAIQNAVYGTSFKDALINAMINEGSAAGADYIGDNNFGPPGSVGHTLAHGVLGAMVESARGGDPLAGALGAMTAAQMSSSLGEALGVTKEDRTAQIVVQALTMLAGGLVAQAAGRDASAAVSAAQNEVINNYLDHLESTEYAALEEKCGRAGSGCTAQEQTRMRELSTLDKARDALLASACANPSSVACAGQLADLNAARMSFSGQDVAAGSRAASELAWIKQEQAKLEARVQSPGTYNVGTAVLEVAGGTIKGTLDLATLSAQAASGDTTAQAQLSQIAEAIGEFFASPVDTIEQHISTTLAEARALDDAGRTDEAQRLRATLFTEGALAVTGTGALVVKGSGKIIATAERVFSDQAERIATRALLESGGMIDAATGQSLLDLKQLSNPQKTAMGELFGEHTVRQIIPDGQKLARMPGPGETGIDDLYKVNRPDVDYVVIEYKFVGTDAKTGAQVLGKTLDGVQGSESWTLGAGRLQKAVGDESAIAVENAVKAGRYETWVVTTRPDGATVVEVLDALGKPKPVDMSKILTSGANLSGAQL